MSLYESSIPQFAKMLRNLRRWLDKASAHATAKSFDEAVLIDARLAPDQFAFVRQVQVACDAAKSAAANLAGREAPKHPDTERTMDELRARIDTVLAYLDTFGPDDLSGAAERRIALAFIPGKVVLGADYLTELALPNFYFHVTTAYAILRHNGVDVGKTDFIGSLKLHDA